MFEAFILLALVAAIVVASRRWPDIERRVFGQGSPIPQRHHHEPTPAAEPEPAAEPKAPSTGGVMRTKPISTEPDLPDGVAPAQEPAAPADEPAPEPSTGEAPTEADTKPTETVAPEPQTPPTPGGRVTGAPARPSQPAYEDATKAAKVSESVDDLAKEADQAYRDRDYERAEAACLKILLKEPKNHKYMTRIGQVYQEMGQLDDAKEAFEAAKNLDPKNFFVLNRLAEVDRLLSDKGGRTGGTKSGK